MARLSRISIAKNDILSHFENSRQRVYSEAQLSSILEEQRAFWRLAERTTTNEFIYFLEEQERLKVKTFEVQIMTARSKGIHGEKRRHTSWHSRFRRAVILVMRQQWLCMHLQT